MLDGMNNVDWTEDDMIKGYKKFRNNYHIPKSLEVEVKDNKFTISVFDRTSIILIVEMFVKNFLEE